MISKASHANNNASNNVVNKKVSLMHDAHEATEATKSDSRSSVRSVDRSLQNAAQNALDTAVDEMRVTPAAKQKEQLLAAQEQILRKFEKELERETFLIRPGVEALLDWYSKMLPGPDEPGVPKAAGLALTLLRAAFEAKRARMQQEQPMLFAEWEASLQTV